MGTSKAPKGLEKGLICLWHYANGLNVPEIAYKLNYTTRTVRYHLDRVKTRYGALNLAQAVYLCAMHGGFYSIHAENGLRISEAMGDIVYNVIDKLIKLDGEINSEKFISNFGELPSDWRDYFLRRVELRT